MGLLGFFFLLFGLFVSLIVFEDPLVRFTKARQELAPSGEKSLIFRLLQMDRLMLWSAFLYEMKTVTNWEGRK